MYLASLSLRDSEPVLIWPPPMAGKVSNEGVFRLARAMRDDVVPAGLRQVSIAFTVGDGADLIELDQHSVGRTLFNSLRINAWLVT